MRSIRKVGPWLIILGATAAGPRPAPGADSPALDRLKQAGLTKAGRVFLIEPEAPVLARIKEARGAINAYNALADRQARIEQAAADLGQLETHRAQLQEQLADLNQRIVEQVGQQAANGGMGGRGGGMMAGGGMGGPNGGPQALIAQRDQIKLALAEVKAEQAQVKDGSPQVSERSAMEADIKARAEALRVTLLELRPAIDGVARKYAELGADPAIKAAIAELEKASKASFKLGPSDAFLAAVRTIDGAEQRLLGKKATTVSRKKPKARR